MDGEAGLAEVIQAGITIRMDSKEPAPQSNRGIERRRVARSSELAPLVVDYLLTHAHGPAASGIVADRIAFHKKRPTHKPSASARQARVFSLLKSVPGGRYAAI